MYYGLVRIIFCAGIGRLIYCFVKKQITSRKHRKIFLIALMAIMLGFYQGTYFFPLENYIYSFSTPEEIFCYTATGKIIDVVEGKETCMIIYTQQPNTYMNLFVKKEDESYKIIVPQPIPTFISILKDENMTRGSLYNFRDGTDAYLTILWSTQREEVNVEDNVGSTFYHVITQSQASNYTAVFSYAYIENYEENYEVKIN